MTGAITGLESHWTYKRGWIVNWPQYSNSKLMDIKHKGEGRKDCAIGRGFLAYDFSIKRTCHSFMRAGHIKAGKTGLGDD